MPLKRPIVLIDDDEEDFELFSSIIENLKIKRKLLFFDTGQKALDYLLTTTDKPFLIICDMNMPGMSGLELRQKINETEYLRTKAIPFVFLTTSADKEAVDKAYQMSVHGFFEKSPDYESYKKIMQQIVEYWDSCKHPNN